jgi:hypothetical protein
MAFDCRRAALCELGEGDRADRGAGFVGERDAAPELDDPVVADVDAVMVVAARAAHFQVIAGPESACHDATLPETDPLAHALSRSVARCRAPSKPTPRHDHLPSRSRVETKRPITDYVSSCLSAIAPVTVSRSSVMNGSRHGSLNWAIAHIN